MEIRSEAAALTREWQEWVGDYGPEEALWCVSERDGSLQVDGPSGEHHSFKVLPGPLPDGREVRLDEGGRCLKLGTETFERFVPRQGEEYRLPDPGDVEELLFRASRAEPKLRLGAQDEADFVDLSTLGDSVRADVRYATDQNFVGAPMYKVARALLQRPAAEALTRVAERLSKRGLGLWVYDAYRPWHVTWLFQEVTPEHLRRYVADPERGSRHNRGCAIDLTLFDLEMGQVLPMPCGFDEFSRRAHADYEGGTGEQRQNRALLREVMEAEGFAMFAFEWWHFDHERWEDYPPFDLRLDEIG
ncbi:MAG: M15 family metallopeptidase [Planctomycetota bacterium]